MQDPCPCKDCQDRSVSCHSTCKAYLGWAKERSDTNKWLQAKAKEDREASTYKFDTTQPTGMNPSKKRRIKGYHNSKYNKYRR